MTNSPETTKADTACRPPLYCPKRYAISGRLERCRLDPSIRCRANQPTINRLHQHPL